MVSPSLRQLREFHRALLLLARAGVRVKLFPGANSGQALEDRLEKIELRAIRFDENLASDGATSTTQDQTNGSAPHADGHGLNSGSNAAFETEQASRSLHTATGQDNVPSVVQSLLTETDIPANYRSALACWCRSGGTSQSLSLLTESWKASHRVLFLRRMRWLTPFIWAAVACIALTILASLVSPRLASLARDVGYQDGFIEFADGLQAWLPLGYIALIGGVSLAYFASQKLPWLRLSKNSNAHESYLPKAQMAARVDQWSHLCELGTPTLEAWDQVAASDLLAGETSPRPPLIEWAISDSSPKESLSDAIESRRRFASEAYRSLQTVCRFGLRNPTPGFAITLFGGILAAALGASIFYPVVQILVFVTNSVGAGQ